MEQATELEFLRYFYETAGDCMGPADDDCYAGIKDSFTAETGKALPEGYGKSS